MVRVLAWWSSSQPISQVQDAICSAVIVLAEVCSVGDAEEVLVRVVPSESDLDGVVKVEKGGFGR
jgi:hypothetical protein